MEKIKIAVAIILATVFVSCSNKLSVLNKKEIASHKSAYSTFQFLQNYEKEKNDFVLDYVSKMDLQEKVSEMFLINVDGNSVFAPIETLSSKPLIPGGYILFSYNLDSSPEKIISFTSSIKDFCKENNFIPPFLSADVEGGYVNRLRGIAGELPEAERVAQCLSVMEAYELYAMNAKQLFALGFNSNLAPIVEVCTDSNKEFLSGRSFGSKENVVKYATAASRAYEDNNIGVVLKHFPGNTNTDPHSGLPEIKMTKDEISSLVIETFGDVIKQNPSGILMSHALTSVYDKNTPACFSNYWITDVIRNQYKFDGIIFSDDIFMSALSKNGYPPEKAALMAVDSGIDCILITEKRFGKELNIIMQTCKKNPDFLSKVNNSVKRILLWKEKLGIINITKEKNEWTLSINQSKTDTDERLALFNEQKEKNKIFYDKYFLPSATNDELIAVCRKQ